jgi:hypothetical protein
MRYEIGNTGHFIDPRDFWPMVDREREAMRPVGGSGGWFRFANGTWYWEEGMSGADRAEKVAQWRRDCWWEEHKRDTSVIAELGDSDLKLFRLLADIRADIPVIDAATRELWRRGIRDYPIAI